MNIHNNWLYFFDENQEKRKCKKKMEWKPETVEYNAVDDKIRK